MSDTVGTTGVRTSANLIKPLVRDADHHYLDPRSSISNDGGLSLPVPGPLPAVNTTTASSFTPSSSKSQRLQVKKKRRKTLSEILRSKGHCIREATQKEDGESSRESGQGTSTMWKQQSLNRYTLPDVFDVHSHRTSRAQSRTSVVIRSDTSVISNDMQQRRSSKLSTLPGVRFRQAVHRIMCQLYWSKKFQGIEQHQKTTYLGPGERRGERELLTFNVRYFRSDVRYESLSLRAKTILSQPTWLRTEEEIQYLHRYTIRLSCFNRYSGYVRRELARVLYYEKIEKDRYVIKQGHTGWFFYFIISGTCLVEMQECLVSGKNVTMIAGEIKAGGSFGELALMHDRNRRASIFTNEDCEFLKVDKPSFDEVLRKSHEAEWNHRLKHLSRHPLFHQWKKANLNTAVEGSQTKEFLPGSVILKDLSVPSEMIHFIIQGSCQVVKKIKLWERVQNYHDDYFMFHTIQQCSAPSSAKAATSRRHSMVKNCKLVGDRVYRLVTKWWVIQNLKEGEYFGLGEGEEGMSVICDQKVVVLLMSKNVFRKHDRGRDLAYLRTEAISWYPSKEEALASYLEWKRWNQFRRNTVLEVLGCKPDREIAENYMLVD